MEIDSTGQAKDVTASTLFRAAIISGLLVLCSVLPLHAQLNQQWANRVDGPGHFEDRANAIVADANDNSYVTGSFCLAASTTGTPPQTQCTSTALLVVKYDETGKVVWQDQVTTNGKSWQTAGTAIALDGAGNVYVTGTGDSGQAIPLNPGITAGELVTIKYSPAGQRLWLSTHVNSAGGISGSAAIKVDPGGNSYIAGNFLRPSGSQGAGMAAIKYDASGHQLWEADFTAPGGPGPTVFPLGLAVDAQGNLYVVGNSNNNGLYPVNYGGFTAKFSTNGSLLWSENSATFSNDAIALDSAGNAYVTGVEADGVSLGQDNPGTEEFVIKYAPAGNHVWKADYQTPGATTGVGNAIALDANGNVYTASRTIAPANPSGSDYSTVKFDATGKALWEALFNGIGNGKDSPVALALDSSANVYVTGQSTGSGTGTDYATVEYDTSGKQLGVARYNGPQNLADVPAGIAFGSKMIFVTGGSQGAGPQDDWATVAYSIGPAPPTITVAPTTLTFSGTVGTVTAAQRVTVTNKAASPLTITAAPAVTGANAGDFTIEGSTTCAKSASVAANNSCTIDVTFKPGATGNRAASLAITDSDGSSPQSVSLSGTATNPATPAVTLSPVSLTFSGAVGTTTSSQSITVANSGAANLSITSIALSGANAGDFAVQSSSTCKNGTSVAAGNSCSVDVAFKATVTGNRSATLVITDNASNSPQSVSLGGTGVNPAGPVLTFSPGSLAFPAEPMGTTTPAQTVTMSNTGGAVLNISLITFGGANFSDFKGDMTCGKTLAPGTNCTASITFTPTAQGNRAAVLSISDDEAGSPHTVSLTGKGVGIALTSAQPTISINAGQTATFNVMLAPTAFTGAANVTCSGAPRGASCTVTPSAVPLSGDTPVPLIVTVTTTARGYLFPWNFRWYGMIWLTLLGAILWSILALIRRPRLRLSPAFALLALLLIASIGCSGATAANGTGGNSGNPLPITSGTPAGTSTLMLTATSGSTQATLPLMLTVN
jgi:hypothetical protein